jgi:hypothetical protein
VALSRGFRGREKIFAARTYYVRTDGSDSNSGLVDSAAGAFLTGQKAIDAFQSIDLNGYAGTVQFGSGTFNGALTVDRPFEGGLVTLRGDPTTPANVVLAHTNNLVTLSGPGARLSVTGLKVGTTGAGSSFALTHYAALTIAGLMDFGAAVGDHISLDTSKLSVESNYNVTGGAVSHWSLRRGSAMTCNSRTIALANTPAFTQWALAFQSQIEALVFAFTSTATGKRFTISHVSTVYDNGGSPASWFPGNAGGTTAINSAWS